MDYEKKYKNALEWARQVMNGETGFIRNEVEEIFPELKESEDEKIRQLLLRFVKYDMSDNYSDDFTPADCVAWLEKQGEQKPADNIVPRFKVGQIIKKEGFNLGFPIVKIEDGFYYNDMGDNFPFTDQDNWELVEQKPAWSEEDEDILNTIINHFKVDIECTDEDDIVRWLKFLKNRIQPQPKKEWSEDDKNILETIISNLKGAKKSQALMGLNQDDYYNRLITWLESFRHQYTWKPSEEQLNALHWCVMSIGSTEHQVLQELLEQLEKLKD